MIVVMSRGKPTPLLCLAICFAWMQTNHAAVISANSSPNPAVGTVNVPIFLPDDVIVQKSYDAAGQLGIVIQVNGPTSFSVTELIDNDSGSDWTEFHWEMLADSATFVDTAIDPFPNIIADSMSIWAAGATVGDGDTFGAILFVDASNVAVGRTETITIRQSPVIVPEPSSLTVLFLCVVPLVCLGGRRRDRSA